MRGLCDALIPVSTLDLAQETSVRAKTKEDVLGVHSGLV